VNTTRREIGADLEGQQLRTTVRPGRRFWRVILGFLVVIALLIAAGVYGVYSGLHERERMQLTAAEEHYERGLRFIAEGDYALAAAEFEYVERIRPGYKDTEAMLKRAREALQRQPTPTSEVRESIAAGLMVRAQDEMEQEQWGEAIATLQELREFLPEYEPEQVETLLFQCAYSAGVQAVADGDVTLALEWFKQALDLRPDDMDARRQIALASSYLAASAAWGQDWPETIARFRSLYNLSPSYSDVESRLATAYVRYADELSSHGEWCHAVQEYKSSLELRDSVSVRSKLALAEKYCEEGVAEGDLELGGTATATAGGVEVASLPGDASLYIPLVDPQTGAVGVYALPPGPRQEPSILIANADQPAKRDDGYLAYRNHSPDRLGLSMAQPDGSFAARITTYSEDGWPTWEPGNGRVAFASTREADRKWRIYVAEGWHVGQEARSIAYGKSPAWGPDGTIAYRGCDQSGSNCGIYLIRADGTFVARVTDNPDDDMPAWSPDGKMMAFASPRSDSWSIWVKDLETDRLRMLTDDQGHDASPVWSPDGQYVAFLSNRGGSWGIWVVSAAGGEPQLLWAIGSLSGNWDEVRLEWR